MQVFMKEESLSDDDSRGGRYTVNGMPIMVKRIVKDAKIFNRCEGRTCAMPPLSDSFSLRLASNQLF